MLYRYSWCTSSHYQINNYLYAHGDETIKCGKMLIWYLYVLVENTYKTNIKYLCFDSYQMNSIMFILGNIVFEKMGHLNSIRRYRQLCSISN